MNQLYYESINLAGWCDIQQLLDEQLLIKDTHLPVARNIFQAQVVGQNSIFSATVFGPALYREIVLDKELIAECRSGEI